MKNFKITIQGMGEVTLNDNMFIAKGGEGSIYADKNIAYKIYEDPKKMIPFGKMQELSLLTHPKIVKPEKLIQIKKDIVGHTMLFVPNTLPLGQIFTKAFKTRNQISHEMIRDLVENLQEIITHIHDKKILVVDLNEYNFLVSEKFKDIYAIDTNSYQTPHYPATAIMDHIRDRHCKNNWSEETDWFSWGVVTCQMFIGLHPYKGGHPKYDSVPVDERLEHRMQNNVSIFNKDSRVPGACFPLDVIPENIRKWYIEVFEKGIRCVPPTKFDKQTNVQIKVRTIAGSNLFDIQLIKEFDEDIIRFYSSNGNVVVVTKNYVYYNNRKYNVALNPSDAIGFTDGLMRPFIAKITNRNLSLNDLVSSDEIPITSYADGILESDGKTYVRNGTDLYKINFIESSFTKAYLNKVCNVLDVPNATKIFDGVLLQNLLGKIYASIFAANGMSFNIKLDELDNHKIIDAKYENKILCVIGVDRKGVSNRFVFRIDDGFQKYDMQKFTDNNDLNFTVADHGAVVFINEDEKLEIWSNKYNKTLIQAFNDTVIKTDMKLYHNGGKIVFTQGNKLFDITMRKKA